MENIVDMKGAYVAHIPVTACSPRTALQVGFPTQNSVQAHDGCSFQAMEERLQQSKAPRVRRGQPAAICLEDRTGTLPRQ